MFTDWFLKGNKARAVTLAGWQSSPSLTFLSLVGQFLPVLAREQWLETQVVPPSWYKPETQHNAVVGVKAVVTQPLSSARDNQQLPGCVLASVSPVWEQTCGKAWETLPAMGDRACDGHRMEGLSSLKA